MILFHESHKFAIQVKIKTTRMNDQLKTAKLSGLFYLLMAIIGGFGYFSTQGLIVQGDPSATAININNSETIYKISTLSNIVSSLLFIVLVLMLHKLLKEVDSFHSKLMVVLVLISIPIGFANILIQYIPLLILDGTIYLESFTVEQQNSLLMLSLEILNYGVINIQIFWGLWLLPLGYLIYKSNFISKIFGILLFAGGLVYVAGSVLAYLLPSFIDTFKVLYVIPTVAEFAFIFWLLIKGVKT